MVAVLQRGLADGFELLGALVEHQAEIHCALIVAAQTRQHPQQLLGARLGAGSHLLHHLAAGVFLVVEGGLVLLVGQREAGLEHRFPEELHQAGQLGPQLVGAGVVLALAAGGQVQHDLFVQGKVGQRLPRQRRHTGADEGVLAGALLAADPDGIVVVVGGGSVPLDLFGRGGDAAAAAHRNTEAAVGAGIPVLDEVRAGEDFLTVGADVLALGAGLAVRVQVPAQTAVDLRMGGLHQRIHGVARKDTHRITPYQRP